VQIYKTDPRKADTDDDGINDKDEVKGTMGFITDPVLRDTDGDSMPDKWEIDNGLNPLDPNDEGIDPDGDGVNNYAELLAGTNPQDADSDDDLIQDGWEIRNGLNPLNPDDADDDPDADGLTNVEEFNLRNHPLYPGSTDPNDSDSDDDGLSDYFEITTNTTNNFFFTDPNNPDTDADGIPDNWEINKGLNPTDSTGDNGATGDPDGDGLNNYEEYLNNSDPNSRDSDGDGFNDDVERNLGTQATNPRDPIIVDDDHPNDPQPQDPMVSNTNENGSLKFPFDAIQEGIDAASDGMTVLVFNGLYNGPGNINIDTRGKAITVMSWNGPANTRIKTYGTGAGFMIHSGETTNTVIRGFKISTSFNCCSDGDCGYEHAIVCKDGSSPYIADCIITNCELAAIYCEFSSSPLVTNCTISYCGTGIACTGGSSPVIFDSTVHNCGLGLSVLGSEGLKVFGSVISNCTGRGVWVKYDPACSFRNCEVVGNYGGFRFENCSSTVDACRVTENIAPDHYLEEGTEYIATANRALYAADTEGAADITDIDENGAGILLLYNSALFVQNSLIANNKAVALDPDYPENASVPAYGLGGGIYIGTNSYIHNINCTIADNAARRGGGIFTLGGQKNIIRNSVLWGNNAKDMWVKTISYNVTNWVANGIDSNGITNYVQEVENIENNVMQTALRPKYSSLHCRSGVFDVWYCDIQNGYDYIGERYNIEVPPVFADAEYHLADNSPCIDAGSIYLAPIYDLDGVARPLDGDNNGTPKIDIGAYEYVHPLADTDGDGTLDRDEIYTFFIDPTETDTDGDGMSDGYEISYGLNPVSNDSDADTDNDGISNGEEFNSGTNPASSDTDGDSSPDGDEAVAGTDPLDPTSYFCIRNVHPLADGNGCELSFESKIGRQYTIYFRDGFSDEWHVLTTVDGTGETVSLLDASAEETVRFYKAEVRRK